MTKCLTETVKMRKGPELQAFGQSIEVAEARGRGDLYCYENGSGVKETEDSLRYSYKEIL